MKNKTIKPIMLKLNQLNWIFYSINNKNKNTFN